MAIFDVIVNTDDLVVLGPPEVIDVAVSVGEQGPRGATFFAGSGDPNDTVVSTNVFGNSVTLQEGDIYINYAVGTDYAWLYIYNPKVTGDQWDEVLRLQPPIYATTYELTFAAGLGTISIPLADILPPGVTEADTDKYVVTLTPISSDPIVLTINSKSIVSTNFEIDVEGLTYTSSTWSSLAATIDISVTIAVV